MRVPAKSHPLVLALRILWLAITLWYELGTFIHSGLSCRWPVSTVPQSHDVKPFHVLIVADPQILDQHSYPDRAPILTYVSRLVVDLNLRKNWYAALREKPDAVVFLGDMMDGGRLLISDVEYEEYFRRFASIFQLDTAIPKYFLPGNHDVGLQTSSSFSPHARSRYRSHFGPLNSRITLANHTLVLLDAPGLVEEDHRRVNAGQTYAQWRPVPNGPVDFVQSFGADKGKDPVILFSHIPLSRPYGASCGPLRERGTIHSGAGFGYQNTLGKEATAFLLENVQPSAVFSGDDHDYCEYVHGVVGQSSGISEVSVKSLSMAMGIRQPGFQMLSLESYDLQPDSDAGPSHTTFSCLLPDQLGIYLGIYIPLLVISLLLLLVSNFARSRASRAHSHESYRISRPTNLTDGRRVTRDKGYAMDDYESTDPPFLLPPPGTARRTDKATLSWTFVMGGRRRRITVGVRPCVTLGWNVSTCIAGVGTGSEKQGGLARNWLGDVRDVAKVPLAVFAVISCWMFIG